MKILERERKESIRFDGVKVRDTYLLRKRRGEASGSTLWDLRGGEMAFEEFHAVRSDNTQGGNCMTRKF